MRAAVWYGTRRVVLEERPRPVPGPDQALVRVELCGLCGSDLEEYLYGPVVARPGTVLGHEIVGTVSQAAADGSGPPVGTPVVVDVVNGCGRCRWCRAGEEGLCAQLAVTGLHMDGGLAEHVVGRACRLVPLPRSVPFRVGALAEPLAVAVRAFRKTPPVAGRRVVILGGGTIGMLCAQVAAHYGAETVAVVEPDAGRRALLATWGATTVWAENAGQRRFEIYRLTDGDGADVVVECVGRPGSVAEALDLAAPAGTVVALGVSPSLEPIGVLDLVLKERTLVGSAAHRWDADVMPAVELLVNGAVDVTPMVTHEFRLNDALEAFRVLASRDASAIKILVRCADPDRPQESLP
jgi:(R,R)-butanediol dehydrogenase/meso-butanediol dehydrogenase/diacetyl reductase